MFRVLGRRGVCVAGMSTFSAPKIAVVLSGCGVYDGSEIHEASHTLSHLTRNGICPIVFAPDVKQHHVINHATQKEDQTHSRNVLEESARIARGDIYPLWELLSNQGQVDGVIFPGGFGVVKNLSDFATKGIDCTVHPDVVSILKSFHKDRKPIGLMCIAPILAARVLCNVRITLGEDNPCDAWPHSAAIDAAKKMGAIVESKNVLQTSYDKENFIFSTPAYMYSGKYHEIDDGIGNMIKYMVAVMKTDKYDN